MFFEHALGEFRRRKEAGLVDHDPSVILHMVNLVSAHASMRLLPSLSPECFEDHLQVFFRDP